MTFQSEYERGYNSIVSDNSTDQLKGLLRTSEVTISLLITHVAATHKFAFYLGKRDAILQKLGVITT